MAIFRTSLGHSVPHCHVHPNPVFPCDATEWTQAQKNRKREYMARHFPNAVEVRPPSRKYNCFGYAYARAHGWFNDPNLFIDDDFSEVPMHKARGGDVLVYKKGRNIVHSAIVKTVTNGKIETVRSKWGKLAAVIHRPRKVHRAFGRPVRLLRRNPS